MFLTERLGRREGRTDCVALKVILKKKNSSATFSSVPKRTNQNPRKERDQDEFPWLLHCFIPCFFSCFNFDIAYDQENWHWKLKCECKLDLVECYEAVPKEMWKSLKGFWRRIGKFLIMDQSRQEREHFLSQSIYEKSCDGGELCERILDVRVVLLFLQGILEGYWRRFNVIHGRETSNEYVDSFKAIVPAEVPKFERAPLSRDKSSLTRQRDLITWLILRGTITVNRQQPTHRTCLILK